MATQDNSNAAKEAAVRTGSQGNTPAPVPAPMVNPITANPPAAADLVVEEPAVDTVPTETADKDTTPEGLSKREVGLITAAIVSANEVKRTTPLPTPGMDKAPAGGQMFIVGGQVVDCNGVVVAKPSSEALAAAKAARVSRTDVTFADEEV